jgi:hypothetical protein
MRRRVEGNLLGTQVFVASPEDTLISKLEWAHQGGGSQLQLRDVSGLQMRQRFHGTRTDAMRVAGVVLPVLR